MDEDDYIIQAAGKFENATARLLTKGRVGIEVDVKNKRMKSIGSAQDIKDFGSFITSQTPDKLVKCALHFGWNMEKGKDGLSHGSAPDIAALVLLMQQEIKDQKMVNRMWADLFIKF